MQFSPSPQGCQEPLAALTGKKDERNEESYVLSHHNAEKKKKRKTFKLWSFKVVLTEKVGKNLMMTRTLNQNDAMTVISTQQLEKQLGTKLV